MRRSKSTDTLGVEAAIGGNAADTFSTNRANAGGGVRVETVQGMLAKRVDQQVRA